MSILTISQLNNYISFKLKSDIKLKGIMVQGEISNFVNHYKSGHMYFTLKDESSALKVVMFSSSASKLRFIPAEGMKVVCAGNIDVYERDGVYQLYVTDMQPSGIGALYLAYEQLKERLLKEGIFNDEFKKPIPEFPKKIGIVTSASGAGLQDIINILSRRYPLAEVIVFPAIVQGELSVDSLCKNIMIADKSDLDVIIIGRGGGSFEDLFSFSDERLIRSVFECKTPVISAVGHETDTTLIDYVSDLRAPTPSAAAELVAPDIKVLYDTINGYKIRLDSIIISKTDCLYKDIDVLSAKLKSLSPEKIISTKYDEIDNLCRIMYNNYNSLIGNKENSLISRIELLSSLNPLSILTRGYSLVYKDNEIIDSSKKVSVGDNIKIKFSNSEISAEVTKL